MAVAVYRQVGDVAVEERPVPTPGPGQVLVEVSHCGICGSDLHLMVEGWGTPGLIGGHEFTGTVAAVGSGVTKWSLGDEVVGGPSPKCGQCRRCLEGKPSQCEQRRGSASVHSDGAFAGYVLVDERALLELPDALSPRAAALAEPLAVALHGITRSRVEVGDSVMVFGAGPIGALSVAALVAMGIGPVIAVEPALSRRRLALELGATEVLEPSELETYPRWEPERLAPNPVDAVLECSGKKAAMESGFSQLRRGGRLVLVGAGMEPPSFDPNRMILNELEVLGSFIYNDNGFVDALDMLASGTLPIDLLIEPQDVPLDQLGVTLEALASGKMARKALVVPRLAAQAAQAAGATQAREQS
jgi:2-desacetyl-2-hydroxyethyl bacteriochlorophyllide A dehydrogenase